MERWLQDRWLIVADDLTGAADCAIAFAARGHHAVVRWGEHWPDGEAAVHAHDTDSRGVAAAEAEARHRAVLATLLAPGREPFGRNLFKKVDSTLRGQPAAELAATLGAVRRQVGAAFCVLAPAFPATGRTTVDGRVRVDGAPLEQAEVWRRDHSYPSADIPAVLAGAGLRAGTVGLAAIRAGTAALRDALLGVAAAGAEVAVCDATADDDLKSLAAATLGAPLLPGLFWSGAAGLAHALAGAHPAAPAAPPGAGRAGGVLVVGSLAAVSRAAAQRLAARPGMRRVGVDAAGLLAGADAAWPRDVADALGGGGDVLVEVEAPAPDLTRGPAIAAALAARLKPAAARMGALAVTGGETAAALLARFGVDGLRLVDEIEPGVVLGRTLGRHRVPIVAKAGAFGTPDTLINAVRRLRGALAQGTVT